ncbi:MAG: B12-binding domain-containing radical SAM protein, partial [Dehalococcoidales bacterium]|nr:B12-binding domain-containing radical SAM protein [Dehalococcoidales bacterium]
MKSLDDILYEVSKPARYSGGEWNSVIKDWQATPIRIALAFPDVYEVGMSNLALPILYEILNGQPDVTAERVYAPWVDMETQLKQHNIPLFSLETRHPLKDFGIIGFSLGYELTYTNVLNMLDLAQIPLFSHQRNDSHPLIIAGGSCALNPEPMADF